MGYYDDDADTCASCTLMTPKAMYFFVEAASWKRRTLEIRFIEAPITNREQPTRRARSSLRIWPFPSAFGPKVRSSSIHGHGLRRCAWPADRGETSGHRRTAKWTRITRYSVPGSCWSYVRLREPPKAVR